MIEDKCIDVRYMYKCYDCGTNCEIYYVNVNGVLYDLCPDCIKKRSDEIFKKDD